MGKYTHAYFIYTQNKILKNIEILYGMFPEIPWLVIDLCVNIALLISTVYSSVSLYLNST